MARRKRGFFASLGFIGRLIIVGLAGIMVIAIVLNFTTEDDIVAETGGSEAEAEAGTTAVDPMADSQTQIGAEGGEDSPAEEEAPTEEAPVEEEAAAEEEAAPEEEAPAAEEAATEEEAPAEEDAATEDEAPVEEDAPAEEDSAAQETDSDAAEADVSNTVDITLDEEGSYEIVNRVEDGDALEITTARTEGERTTYTIHRILCGDMTMGLIGEGDDPDAITRTDEPEMLALDDETIARELAMFACGNG